MKLDMKAPSAQVPRRQIQARQASMKQGPVKQVLSKILTNQPTIDHDEEEILVDDVNAIDQDITSC